MSGRLISARRVLVGVGLLLLASGAPAQEAPPGCTAMTYANPSRQVLRCPDMTIEAEAGTRFQTIDANRDGVPEGVDLGGGAVLIEIVPGRVRSFKVQTPHAIASVRGTLYVVDVEPAKTAVFVARGLVGVRKAAEPREVVLERGEGVDVEAGVPLEKKVWGSGRVMAVLARFAR